MNSTILPIIKSSYLVKYFLFITIGIFYLTSCASDSSPSSYVPPMTGAIGKTSEVVVIADEDVWEGTAGDTFRYYFSSAYLILPQPEPILDIRHLTPQQLVNDPMLRELRTYVLLGNLKDVESPTTKMIKKDIGEEKVKRALDNPNFHTVVGHNKWARGQMLTFIFGKSEDAIADNVKSSYPTIAKRIHEFDQKQIGTLAYIKGRNHGVEKVIKDKLGAEMKIPQEYFVAVDEENTVWLRKETPKVSFNIFVHKLPYTSQAQFTQKSIRSIRDTLGKRHVTTEIEGAFMRTNDVDLPMFVKTMELDGSYTVEARGIWDLVNDFMGGPFIGYLIHNKSTNELLYVEGFIHAPTTTKRKSMQLLEHILRQTKFGDGEATASTTEE